MLNTSILGRKITDARKAKGFTQAELAEMAGVSRASISLYESGNGHPSYKVLGKLSQILGSVFAQEVGVPSDDGSGEATTDSKVTAVEEAELQLMRAAMDTQQAQIVHLQGQFNRLEAQMELLIKMVGDSRK